MHVERINKRNIIIRGFCGMNFGVEEFRSICQQAKNQGIGKAVFFQQYGPFISADKRHYAEEIWEETLKMS